jgi:hypothetical protein
VAQASQVPFFGGLWVLDHFVDEQVLEGKVIAAGLELIAAHPRRRLPKAEVHVRLERYRKPYRY